MLVRLVCWLLKYKKLTTHERGLLTNQVLNSIDALPTRAIITLNEGKIFIQGVPLDTEKNYVLREAAESALHNPALKFVHDQVLYQAVSLGVHQAQTVEQIQFSKAAIWYGQQELELLKTLSTMSPTELGG